LERANTSLRNDMEREKKKKDLLGKEVRTQNPVADLGEGLGSTPL